MAEKDCVKGLKLSHQKHGPENEFIVGGHEQVYIMCRLYCFILLSPMHLQLVAYYVLVSEQISVAGYSRA